MSINLVNLIISLGSILFYQIQTLRPESAAHAYAFFKKMCYECPQRRDTENKTITC